MMKVGSVSILLMSQYLYEYLFCMKLCICLHVSAEL